MSVKNLNECFVSFCSLREKILNEESIEDIKFMYPTTLVPLLPFIECGVKINNDIGIYVTSISEPVKARPDFTLEKIERGKTFFKMDSMIELLSTKHNKSTLQYLFTELLTNIYVHSDFKTAFAMAQIYPDSSFIEFCLYDDGITIPESLRHHDDSFKSIEDCHLINHALNGKSSKAKNDFERGFGMNTSAQVIIDGYGGELFISSLDGSIFIKSGDKQPVLNIHDKAAYYRINGTLVGLRIPCREEKVSYYPYLEKRRSFIGKEVKL